MPAIEFQASIVNGTVEIPAEHRHLFRDRVRVTLRTVPAAASEANLIDKLLKAPLKSPTFRPLTREDAHAR